MTGDRTRVRISTLREQGRETDHLGATPGERIEMIEEITRDAYAFKDGGPTLLNEDYREMLSAFSEEGVRYLLVGAFAMAAHDRPRTTGDMALWVEPTEENAARVVRALARFGAPVAGIAAGDFAADDVVFQIGVVPRRIDVLTSIDGVAFEEAWPERLVARVAGLDVPVIGRTHLIRNKRATGRPKDLVDAQALEAAREP
jgi:hypothetical protein